MRTLVYGMQSSGASLFTYFLSQRPDTIGVIDFWAGGVAPDLSEAEKDVILKCTVAPLIPLEKHLASYKPDLKILFLRSATSNYESLSAKGYRDAGGKIEDKFAELQEHVERQSSFDYVIHYEDFLNDPPKLLATLGGLVSAEFYDFKRTKQKILSFNRTHSAWCRKNYNKRWGFGNIHFEKDGTLKLFAGKREVQKTKAQRLYEMLLGRR